MFEILALTGMRDPSGVLCLAAIPCLFIAILCYRTGLLSGSASNACIFFVCLFALKEVGYHANRTQENFLKADDYRLMEMMDSSNRYEDGAGLLLYGDNVYAGEKGDMVLLNIYAKNCYTSWTDKEFISDSRFYIPQDELDEIRTRKKEADLDDFYILEELYPSSAVENGIPQWLWHPAAPIYIFGIAGLPAILIGGFIISKLKN